MANAIETIDLSKTYKGGVQALKSLNVKIKRGESIGYLGPNGAGKTTTIQILLNLIKPTKGEAYLFDEPLIGHERDLLLNVGTLVELPGFYDYLTPKETLKYICKIYRMTEQDIDRKIDEVLETMHIRDVRDKKIGTFSTGMKRRVAIAQALIHDPELLILDEPTIGLDPKGVREIRDLVKGLNKSGITIFLTSHNLVEVSEISDRVLFLRKGELVKDLDIADLQGTMSKKQIEVKFLNSLTEEQKKKILAIDNVVSGDFSKTTQLQYNGDTTTTQQILTNMVNDGIPVYSFTPRSMNLEDLYMELFGEEASK